MELRSEARGADAKAYAVRRFFDLLGSNVCVGRQAEQDCISTASHRRDTRIVHGDLFVLAGAGRTADATVLGLTWEAGVGAKLYFNRFLAFRLDLRDFLLPQEVLGRGRITNNVTILAGFSLWLG